MQSDHNVLERKLENEVTQSKIAADIVKQKSQVINSTTRARPVNPHEGFVLRPHWTSSLC